MQGINVSVLHSPQRPEVLRLLQRDRRDFMKAICALLATLALSGCCLSGIGCDAPQATVRVDSDGLDQPAPEGPPAPSQRVHKRAKSPTESAAASAKTANDWEEEQVRQQADEARLKQKLIICQNCGAADPAGHADGTGAATR